MRWTLYFGLGKSFLGLLTKLLSWYFLGQCEVSQRLTIPRLDVLGLGVLISGVLGLGVLVLGVAGF